MKMVTLTLQTSWVFVERMICALLPPCFRNNNYLAELSADLSAEARSAKAEARLRWRKDREGVGAATGTPHGKVENNLRG